MAKLEHISVELNLMFCTSGDSIQGSELSSARPQMMSPVKALVKAVVSIMNSTRLWKHYILAVSTWQS